jgi:myosin-5
LRNDNSSRFGKFIEINFLPNENLTLAICGATVRVYLLEKVRLVHQNANERNYHCFYEMFRGADEDDKVRMGLTSINDFHYLNQSGCDERHDGVDDASQFRLLQEAMRVLTFSDNEQRAILDIAAAVLHVGNIQFVPDENDGSRFDAACETYMEKACSLLGIDADGLEKAICQKVVVARGETFVKVVSIGDAEHSRDTLVKTIYGALFDWLVHRINSTITVSNARPTNMNDDNENYSRSTHKGEVDPTVFIGVLDIFGFESFATNSFEQLCINYTNEILQQHFNAFVFEYEQELYNEEGICVDYITFPDNKDTLDLLDNKATGLFTIMDDQVKFPWATGANLAGRYYETCFEHPKFHAAGFEKARNLFVVKHFAGSVTYDTANMLQKNHDVVKSEVVQLLKCSSCWLMGELYPLFPVDEGSVYSPPRNRKSMSMRTPSKRLSMSSQDVECLKVQDGNSTQKRRKSVRMSMTLGGSEKHILSRIQTVSSRFRRELDDLTLNIKCTNPHYIRCIKPNAESEGDIFDSRLVKDQLRFAGVLETVRVTRAGYPNRISFPTFIERYKSLARSTCKDGQSEPNRIPEMCEILAEQILASSEYTLPVEVQGVATTAMVRAGVQVGKTRVFLRRKTFDLLESLKVQQLVAEAVKIQSVYRMMRHRNHYKVLRAKVVVLQCWLRAKWAVVYAQRMRVFKSAAMINRFLRGMVCRCMRYRVLRGIRLLQAIYKLHYAVKMKRAALAIQCKVRRRLAERVLREKKRERMTLLKVTEERDSYQQRAAELKEERDVLAVHVSNLEESNMKISAQINEISAKLVEVGELRERELADYEEKVEAYELREKLWRNQTFCQKLCRLFQDDPEPPEMQTHFDLFRWTDEP